MKDSVVIESTRRFEALREWLATLGMVMAFASCAAAQALPVEFLWSALASPPVRSAIV
jgi:hypothetical protein